MLLFGLPLFGLYALRGAESRVNSVLRLRAIIGWLAAIALGLSVLSITAMTASMAGVSISAVDPAAIKMMMTDTPMGHAWVMRMAALVAAMLSSLVCGGRKSPIWLVLVAFSASVALASLAWTGHGAASDGIVGSGQLIADILHLFAAGAWLGALLALGLLLYRPISAISDDHARLTYRALEGFSVVGTVIVALIVVSGLVNSWILVGPQHVLDLPATRYGQLLIVKLVLFAIILGLAALNRFQLTPAFELALKSGGTILAIRRLRYSLIMETSAVLAILGLVAWLGTLEPPMSM